MCPCNPKERVRSTEEVPPKNAPEVIGSAKASAEEASCICGTMCEKLKEKLRDVDSKEIFDATMEHVRKRPLLGVLVAGVVGYFLGRLSKKFL